MGAESLSTVFLPPASAVSTSLGPLLTVIMIEQFLLGIVCSQATTYFRYHFCGDGRFIRSIVTFLVVLTIFLGALDFVAIYQTTILDFGNFNKFDLQNWTGWVEPGVTALVALIAHIFYIGRCWTITRSLPFVVFLGIVALLAFASGITVSVYCFVLGRLSELAGAKVTSYIWFLSTSICDLSIASFLAVYFWRNTSVVRNTNVMLSRLRRTTIEAGSLTAVCALLNLILFATLAPSSYYLLAQYSMSHLYTLSVLYTLLGRQGLREILGTGTGTLVTGFTHTSSPSLGRDFFARPLNKLLSCTLI